MVNIKLIESTPKKTAMAILNAPKQSDGGITRASTDYLMFAGGVIIDYNNADDLIDKIKPSEGESIEYNQPVNWGRGKFF